MDSNKKIGPIVAGLVIALIVIIGGLYFFARDLNTNKDVTPTPAPTTVTTTADVAAENDAAVIQADLDSQASDLDYSF
jgi:putative effector of murein hydrolase